MNTPILTLPTAWKDRLGEFPLSRPVTVELGDGSEKPAEVCGPALFVIEGFPEVSGEVLFVEMKKNGKDYQPLIGHFPLQRINARVDFKEDKLVPLKSVELK